jgi:hypothetical protein
MFRSKEQYEMRWDYRARSSEGLSPRASLAKTLQATGETTEKFKIEYFGINSILMHMETMQTQDETSIKYLPNPTE